MLGSIICLTCFVTSGYSLNLKKKTMSITLACSLLFSDKNNQFRLILNLGLQSNVKMYLDKVAMGVWAAAMKMGSWQTVIVQGKWQWPGCIIYCKILF